ncbi:hypothetical protein [Rubrivivax rivuli]|uniref:PH domain-containing protein n=1 Tax=Rubrivivax rivuli TaxID=1862385 RepID=A0A437RAS4_9BURK|nr:hypothetical protein [Rubrivivax rivuli]RVU43812.1 hypothetical protein EOE66_19280 [Rubrivivax rivuli]
MAAPDQSFRYAFMPIWRLQTTICTAAIMAVWVLLSVLLDRPLTRPGLLTSLSTSASCAVALGMVIALARFRVGPEGLRTFNSFGRWRCVPWAAIERVEPARYYFLPHLRLTVDGHRTKHWVPLFLHDMGGFRQAVAQAAGARHPLARALPIPASAAHRDEAP